MLDYHGVQISEPMALGLSSSIAFAYLPFIKLNGLPLIAYRMPPRSVIKGLKKRLKLNLDYEKFTDPKKGMIALDKQLDAGNIVGLQTSVYWLPYFPDDMRFHFNAHNLLVYAKKNNTYLISDPVFEKPVSCSADELQKARFARGALAPKGMMYFINKSPSPVNYTKLIPLSIKSAARSLTAPVPIIGIRGIRFLAKKLARLDRTMPDKKQQILFLGHIIRMQEEIGTGGAGFRYMYASFLQESATLMNNKLLEDASNMMTDVGDHWRNFALHTVKMCKNRSRYDLRELSKLLHKCASEELKVWKLLKKI